MPDKMKRKMVLVAEVVVVGLVLLVAFAAARYLLLDEWIKTEQAKNDIRWIERVLAAYYAKHGFYPDTLEALTYPDPLDKSPPWLSKEEQERLIDPWGQPYGYDLSSKPWREGPLVYSLGPPGQGKFVSNQ
jgi:hypothetical protein